MTARPAYEYLARVERVVDGDTCRLSVDLGFGVTLADQPVRLAGINAPEIGTAAGAAASASLVELLEAFTWERAHHAGRWLLVRSRGRDKYGRLLLELDGVDRGAVRVNLNQAQVDHGHAVRVP